MKAQISSLVIDYQGKIAGPMLTNPSGDTGSTSEKANYMIKDQLLILNLYCSNLFTDDVTHIVGLPSVFIFIHKSDKGLLEQKWRIFLPTYELQI